MDFNIRFPVPTKPLVGAGAGVVAAESLTVGDGTRDFALIALSVWISLRDCAMRPDNGVSSTVAAGGLFGCIVMKSVIFVTVDDFVKVRVEEFLWLVKTLGGTSGVIDSSGVLTSGAGKSIVIDVAGVKSAKSITLTEEACDFVSVTFACGGGWMAATSGNPGAEASSGVGLKSYVSCASLPTR